MRRKKIRVFVDVTFNEALTLREGAYALRLLLERLDLDARPIYLTGNLYANRLDVKETKQLR